MVKLWGESVKSRPAHPIDKEGPITEPSPRYSRTLDQTTLDLTKAIIKRRGSFLGACRDRRTTADPKISFSPTKPDQCPGRWGEKRRTERPWDADQFCEEELLRSRNEP